MGVEGILVGHGGARKIGSRDAAARRNAVQYCFAVSPHEGLMWLAIGSAGEVAGDKAGARGHGAGMRWVLMLFMIFAAVMVGEACAAVSERVGKET